MTMGNKLMALVVMVAISFIFNAFYFGAAIVLGVSLSFGLVYGIVVAVVMISVAAVVCARFGKIMAWFDDHIFIMFGLCFLSVIWFLIGMFRVMDMLVPGLGSAVGLVFDIIIGACMMGLAWSESGDSN